jgi:hypothetical protein
MSVLEEGGFLLSMALHLKKKVRRTATTFPARVCGLLFRLDLGDEVQISRARNRAR